jgi:hypothetical protein
MRYLLLGLSACWSPSPPASKAPAPERPVVVMPAPVTPSAPAYRLPSDLAAALATEPLAGNVLVPHGMTLFSNEGAARAAGADPKTYGGIAMRVVRDLGDVVEVETGRTADCMDGFAEPYALSVFVRRERLVLRAKHDRIKMFADGTGVAIDAGAPVTIGAKGPAWMRTALAALPVEPSEAQLTYAVPARKQSATLPAMTAGDRLICDQAGPKTIAELDEARRREREAELRAQREEQERRRAEWEAGRAERERKRAAEVKACKAAEAREAKKKKKKPKTLQGAFGSLTTSKCDNPWGSLTGSGAYWGEVGGVRGTGIGEVFGRGNANIGPPYCAVTKPWDDDDDTKPKQQVNPPKLNGVAMPWPESEYASTQGVYRVGGKNLANIEHGCDRVRVTVEETALSSGGTGRGYGMIGGRAETPVQIWIPKPGKVTWPDGSPAGTYAGHKRYRSVVEQDTRICVKVGGVAELVCHDKATAKTQMVNPSSLRD